jgi:hypothetical protein
MIVFYDFDNIPFDSFVANSIRLKLYQDISDQNTNVPEDQLFDKPVKILYFLLLLPKSMKI